MSEKNDDVNIAAPATIGSIAVGGSSVAKSYLDESLRERTVKEVDSKRIDHFLKKLKKGDIILESDPKGTYSGSAFRGIQSEDVKKFLKDKTLLNMNEEDAKRIAKQLEKIKFKDAVQLGGGGSRYTHASIYLGDGKIAEMVGRGAVLTDLKDSYKNKRFMSLRVTEDAKTQNAIAKTAKDLLKDDIMYRGDKDLIKDVIKRNLFGVKNNYDGFLTCTEFANESVQGGTKKSFINSFRAVPSDFIDSKNLTVSGSYNFGQATKKEQVLSFIGKNFKNGKFFLIGAGIGAATAIGLSLYNKHVKNKLYDPKKGQWVTSHGRRIYIRNKK